MDVSELKLKSDDWIKARKCEQYELIQTSQLNIQILNNELNERKLSCKKNEEKTQ